MHRFLEEMLVERLQNTAGAAADEAAHSAHPTDMTLPGALVEGYPPPDAELPNIKPKHALSAEFDQFPPTIFKNGAELIAQLSVMRHENTIALRALEALIRRIVRNRVKPTAYVDPDDIVQKVFMNLNNYSDGIDFPDEAIKLTVSMTYRRIFDAYHRARRRHNHFDSLEAMSELGMTRLEYENQDNPAEDMALQVDAQAAMEHLLRLDLDDVEREIVGAWAFGPASGYSIGADEIAKRHNVLPGAVRLKASRLRKKLRKNRVLRQLWCGEHPYLSPDDTA